MPQPLNEVQFVAKTNASIAAQVTAQLDKTGDMQDAIGQVAKDLNIHPDIVANHYKNCAGDGKKRKPDSFHIDGWVQDVINLLDQDKDMLLYDACQVVFNRAEAEGVELHVESAQRMSNLFGTFVGRGSVKYNIFSRVKNKISDPKPPSAIRAADSKRMVREYLRLNHLGVRDKTEMVNKIVRFFHHKYPAPIVEEFLSKQEKWDRIVG